MIATGYEQWRMQAHSVPGGAWTATFGIMASAAFNDNFCSFGVMVKNAGTNTNYSVFKAMVQAGLFSLTTYNSPSGGVANIYQIGYQAASWINWLRIAFDTTTYRFQVSANGLQWVDFTTQTAASWVNAPAQVCFGGCGGNGGNSINVSLVSFTLV
jgi:hypothetical protein